MHIYGSGTLHRWIRRAWIGTQPRILILLYHHVAELSSDPQLMSVTPEHFKEHLEILRRYYQPLSLRQLTQSLQDGNIHQKGVIVTFDDGYADNLYNAEPLLKSYNIPATVFITSGYIGQEREFWWDELERILLYPCNSPEILQLPIKGRIYQWELGEAAYYSENDFQRLCRWNLLEKDDPTMRQSLYRSLCKLLRPLPMREQQKVLDELISWAGKDKKSRQTHHVLSSEEVAILADMGIDIGAHTMTHSVLSRLSIAEQRTEIYESKVILEEIIERPVTSFSYPYGSRDDYTKETVTIARDAGFTCACSNFADVILRRSDFFQLPRFLVRNWGGEEFARRLRMWIRG